MKRSLRDSFAVNCEARGGVYVMRYYPTMLVMRSFLFEYVYNFKRGTRSETFLLRVWSMRLVSNLPYIECGLFDILSHPLSAPVDNPSNAEAIEGTLQRRVGDGRSRRSAFNDL